MSSDAVGRTDLACKRDMHMSWARIMTPLSGGEGDKAAVAAGVRLAEPFGAELTGVYTPADVADVMPWMGEASLAGSRHPPWNP